MNIRLLSSDIDGTVLGKPDATLDFRENWLRLDESIRPLLCYNTGRELEDTKNCIRTTSLPAPDYLICGVGTVIYDWKNNKQVKGFSEILEEGWDHEKVDELMETVPGIRKQPPHHQNEFKSSWWLEDASHEQLEGIEQMLAAADLEVHVVYSSGRDLDVLPKYANKGNALKWLLKHLKIGAESTIVAGDTGNDITMFQLRGVKGILPDNAQPELLERTVGKNVYKSHGHCADGVLDGLKFFGLFKEIVPSKNQDMDSQPHTAEIKHLFQQEEIEHTFGDDDAYLKEAYQKAINALERNITPQGFSACSIEDNETSGTDDNYHSVWGRDGSITVLGTLGINRPEFRACQKATLETLITHISPVGQIPANVHIIRGEPDYSGVGGIASIDSGMWLIIAFYEYVRTTKDLDFARKHRKSLQRAMVWLSAHDSNNDALLEIPEAGDWMDIFNRSYNVLVDEVIWYRTNLCWGRMLELLGDYDKARDYIVWSESIRRAINTKFWPSTSAPTKHDVRSFTEVQNTLGDSSYLLAQIAPFSFDWRCDVYGNVLAFLFNVIDISKARTAFRFLWGVGANEPYPVSNLYPVLHPGDPDWRGYFTVNLLNLPHHYHNGGLWPFIGGQWVRFVNRLGLRDVAYGELVKLAELNQLGVRDEWEFNEWSHGRTGRPMGKAYQAWSASEFVRAYQDMGLSQK